MDTKIWTIKQATKVTADMIQDGMRKFNVIEENATHAITVEIEHIKNNGEVLYSIVEHGRVQYYGENSVEDFVTLYLDACDYVSPHWTKGA